jgi:sugar/nucleoside kinase (ribokinase family)
VTHRLGVVGTMVWDTIYGRGPTAEPVEEWGGIAYALAALEAALTDDWEIVPLVRVGRDLAPEANAFLRQLTRRAATARFIEVPEPNNRVTLRYSSAQRRTERLTGGVPPWTWGELGPLVRDLDALYVNFIAGAELDLATALQLRHGFDGPIYADLHSLLLGVSHHGDRFPQPLPDVDRWFGCFDVVQLNEEEMQLVGSEPMAVAAAALARGVRLLVVTLAARGAVYFTVRPFAFAHAPAPAPGPIETGLIAAEPLLEGGDATGCGDVFGGTLVARLLQGTPFGPALRAANVAAGRNLRHRGASRLQYHLRGEIAPR